MLTETTVLPNLASSAAELVLVAGWTTAGPHAQRQAADAALAAWQDRTWPPGLLAHHCLLGEDGTSVLHYLRWSGQDACRAGANAGAGAGWARWIRPVDTAMPGIHRDRVTPCRLYRSTTPPAGAPPARRPSAGCVAMVTVDFSGPDQQRQRAWIDSVFDAAGTDRVSPADGLIAAHFHVSLDGNRVLNLAEWTTAQAHRQAAAEPAPRVRRTTQHFPGVASIAVHRFLPYRGLNVHGLRTGPR